jgi:hypothetical protein
MICGFITFLQKKVSFQKSWTGAASTKFIRTDDLHHNTVSAAAAAAAGGWGFVLRLKFKVLPTGKTCLLSQIVGTLTIPLGYFPTMVGVPYLSPLMVNELHTSAFECYRTI